MGKTIVINNKIEDIKPIATVYGTTILSLNNSNIYPIIARTAI